LVFLVFVINPARAEPPPFFFFPLTTNYVFFVHAVVLLQSKKKKTVDVIYIFLHSWRRLKENDRLVKVRIEFLCDDLGLDDCQLECIANQLCTQVCMDGTPHAMQQHKVGVPADVGEMAIDTREIQAGRVLTRGGERETAAVDCVLELCAGLGHGRHQTEHLVVGDVVKGRLGVARDHDMRTPVKKQFINTIFFVLLVVRSYRLTRYRAKGTIPRTMSWPELSAKKTAFL